MALGPQRFESAVIDAEGEAEYVSEKEIRVRNGPAGERTAG